MSVPFRFPNRRARRVLPAALVAWAVGGAVPSAAGAQELGLSAVGASSANPELPDARGFGAFAQLEAGSWRARLSLLRYSDDTAKSGTVCQVYSPRIGCVAEGVATTARLSGLRFTLLRAVRLGERVEVGGGAGVSFNTLAASSRGESGRRADLYLPNTGQLGYLGAASLAVAPLPEVPVRLVAGASGHWVRFNGCTSAEDRTSGYAPFCGWDRFTEIQIGLSVVVPRP